MSCAGSRRGVGRRGRGRRPCGAPCAPLREKLGGPEQGPAGQSEGASLGAARALGGVAQAHQARGHDEATRLGGGCVRRVRGCRGRQPGAGRVVGGHPGGLWPGRGSLGSSPGLLCQGHGRLRPLPGAACRVARTHRAGEGRAQVGGHRVCLALEGSLLGRRPLTAPLPSPPQEPECQLPEPPL